MLAYFRTIALALFAVAFTGIALSGIFSGHIDAPLSSFGTASLTIDPLRFWIVATLYFAAAAVCGYFAVRAAPGRASA